MAERLRARLMGAPEPTPVRREADAAALLAAQRGRAAIQPPPTAGRTATAVLRPILSEKGLGLTELKRRWADIVGEGVAKAAWPEKLAAGVLTVKAHSAIAPFVQHQIPLILERCRLAGASVRSVRIEQGQAKKPPANVARIRRRLTAEEEAALAAALARIEAPSLKSALQRLGAAVARR